MKLLNKQIQHMGWVKTMQKIWNRGGDHIRFRVYHKVEMQVLNKIGQQVVYPIREQLDDTT